MDFPLLLLEAGLSVFNVTFWLKKRTSEKELTKKGDFKQCQNKLYKNVYLEKPVQ